ncbi:MAG: Uma2 family endonuclease [Planctomycetaceae bacterium]
MIERGVFEEESVNSPRIELIHGALHEMPPPNPPHAFVVDWLTEWTFRVTSRAEIKVRVQNPLGVPKLDSLPMPDLAWMRNISFRERHPLPSDVLLLIEVADTSLQKDLGIKAELYAEASIADYWVVDINASTIHVHRDPVGTEFATRFSATGGDHLSPLAKPDARLSVADLFAT